MGFDPQKHLIKLKGKEYLEVKWRLVWLREVHPDAVITTELVDYRQDHAIFRATVALPSGASATGYGSEDPKGFLDFIEKAETKAIGRALGALGFGTQFADDFADASGPIADAPVSRPDRPGRAEAPTKASRGVDAPPDVKAANDRLHDVADRHGITHADLHNWAERKGKRSLREMPGRMMATLADRIEANPDEARAYFLSLATEAAVNSSTPTSEPLPGISSTPTSGSERFLN